MKMCITDMANTCLYMDDSGDFMENGSNGSTTLKQTVILRGNKDRVKNDPVFIRNIVIYVMLNIIIHTGRKQHDN